MKCNEDIDGGKEDILRTIKIGEGLTVVGTGKNDKDSRRIQVRAMLDGVIGWVSECETGNQTNKLAQVAADPFELIYVDAKNTQICGIYNLIGYDSDGYPKYAKEGSRLLFYPEELCWMFLGGD